MTQQHIILGTPPSGVDGDSTRLAMQKIEANFTDLYGGAAPSCQGWKNLLINPAFTQWQEGGALTVPDAAATYIADQWIAQQHAISGYQAYQFSYSSSDPKSAQFGSPTCLILNNTGNTDAAAHYSILCHRIENVIACAGKTFTVRLDIYSVAARNISLEGMQIFGSGGSTGVLGISPDSAVKALAPGWNTVYWSITFPAIAAGTVIGAGNHTQLCLWLSGGTNFNARSGNLGAQTGQVSVGYMAMHDQKANTDIEIRPPQVELALCQRYFEPIYGGRISGLALNSGVILAQAAFKVAKRGASTLTLLKTSFAAGTFELLVGTTWVTNASATLTGPNTSVDCANFQLNNFTGLTSGQVAFFNLVTTAVISANARL